MYAEVAIAFIFACITSYILVPRFIKVAHKVGAIDVPKDNRRMHKRPIPKFGGPAVICGFLVATIYLIGYAIKLALGELVAVVFIIIVGVVLMKS